MKFGEEVGFIHRCVSSFWPHFGAAEIWSSPQVFVFIKYEWVVIGDVLGVQVFGTNSRFYLVDRSFGEFFAFVFMLFDLGEGRDCFKTLTSLYFLLWDLETLAPVSATLGALNCLPEHQAVALRWRLLPHFRFFAAAASLSRTITGQASCDHTLPAELGYAHAAPTSPAGLAYGGATNGPTCPSLAVAGRTGPGGLGRLCWKGRWGEGAAPRQRPSPGAADPQRSQLAQRHGRRFPEGVCGPLLPGDRALGIKFMT